MSVRRLKVVHTTGFRYDGPVTMSYNEARMTPRTTSRQVLLDETVTIMPSTWRHRYVDYWGSVVTAFDVVVPHTELTLVSSSIVEVAPSLDDGARDVGWDALGSAAVQDEFTEFLTQTPFTQPPPEVEALARDAVGSAGPHDAALAVCEALTGPMTYEPGVTSVQTPAVEVWAARRGVCQDFAHLTLGALRSVGLPARYVSGYLPPERDAGPGRAQQSQTHAWVEWWAGEWRSYDPTHAGPITVDHVMVAAGRDYHDVPPLRGIYAGAETSELFVSVEVTRQS